MCLINLLDIISKIVIIVGIPFAVIQLVIAFRRHSAQSINDVIKEIGSDKIQQARYEVHNTIRLTSSEEFKRLTEEQRKTCRKLAVAYDRVGFFIQNNLIPAPSFIKWHGQEIKRLWVKLQHVVTYVRKNEGRSDYCRALEYLANEKCAKIK